MENNDLLKEISRRLGILIALQMKTQSEDFSTTDGIKILSRFKMVNNEIAEILNTSANTVNVIKNRLKNKK